jgi:hypothetical protein
MVLNSFPEMMEKMKKEWLSAKGGQNALQD